MHGGRTKTLLFLAKRDVSSMAVVHRENLPPKFDIQKLGMALDICSVFILKTGVFERCLVGLHWGEQCTYS